MTVHQVNQLGHALQGDILAWGAAAIGIAIVAATALWIMRLVR